jgi:glutamate dehydrogenase/leucine dehydrogenase
MAVTTRKLSTIDGFVVTDLGTEGPAAGIVRCAPKVLVDGATWLARSQTYQFASFERKVRGASAAVNAAPDLRDDAVAGFVAELAAELDAGTLLLEPARGLTAVHADALRAHDPRPTTWWEHRHDLRGAGVAAAIGAVAPGARVAIEGFDDAGPALAAAVVEQGGTVVAVGTTAGSVAAPGGLDPAALEQAWAASGAGFVKELGEEPSAADAVFAAEADVLVAGSKAGVVDHELAAGLGVKAVVPGAPLPVTAKALAALRRAGVVVLPDFVTTAGPLFAWPADGGKPTYDDARTAATAAIAAIVAEVVGHPSGPLLGACERAEAFLTTWASIPFGRPIA